MDGRLNDLNELPPERKLFDGNRYTIIIMNTDCCCFNYLFHTIVKYFFVCCSVNRNFLLLKITSSYKRKSFSKR